MRRDNAAMAELSVAQNTALLANINRDPKHTPKPFRPLDFCLFARKDEQGDGVGFPLEAAAAALALRTEDRLPEVLIGAWPAILAAAEKAPPAPEIRAFASDDGCVSLLAPVREGNNWRGLLCVSQARYGAVVLRDVDRPLITHTFELPNKPHYSYIEAGVLLPVVRAHSGQQQVSGEHPALDSAA